MRVLLCCLSILVPFFMVSCNDTKSSESGNIQGSMQEKRLNSIKKEAGLNFPEGSKLIHFFEPERFVDPVWVAKVIIPASSYDSFKRVVLEKASDETVYNGALADSTSWWKPISVVMRKQYLADRHTFVNLVLSEEGVDVSVYIECAVF